MSQSLHSSQQFQVRAMAGKTVKLYELAAEDPNRVSLRDAIY